MAGGKGPAASSVPVTGENSARQPQLTDPQLLVSFCPLAELCVLLRYYMC